LKERGIDKMLEEAREDHKESDAIHMRRNCEFDLDVYEQSLICIQEI
jgi:hypothetical protein